jgi:hypothetical protein
MFSSTVSLFINRITPLSHPTQKFNYQSVLADDEREHDDGMQSTASYASKPHTSPTFAFTEKNSQSHDGTTARQKNAINMKPTLSAFWGQHKTIAPSAPPGSKAAMLTSRRQTHRHRRTVLRRGSMAHGKR